MAAMKNTDDRIKSGASITPGFLVAVLLWDDFQARSQEDDIEDDPAFVVLKDQQSSVDL